MGIFIATYPASRYRADHELLRPCIAAEEVPVLGSRSMHSVIARSDSSRSNKPVVRRRVEFYYHQFDTLRSLRQEARRDLLAKSGKHTATKVLLPDPVERPDLGGDANRVAANAAPVSHRATGANPLNP